MQDRPTAAELLETLAELLAGDVLAAVRGPLQHQVRVAANLCGILEREARLGPEHGRRELARLRALVGEPASGEAPAQVAELNARLAERLAAGADDAFEARAWAALVEITRDKLAVNKPGHDVWDFSEELA